MLICAGAILESAHRLHRPGCLRLEKGKIRAVGPSLLPLPGEEVHRWPEITLTPGWINLHAHLELGPLHQTLPPGPDFAGWLKELIPLLPSLTPEVRRQAILTATRHAARSGTTSILSILTQRAALAGLTSTPTRVWWALEFMDLHEKPDIPAILNQATAWISRHPNSPWHLALSPHAPYTASPALYHALSLLAEKYQLPFTTHLAESTEENSLLSGLASSLRPLLPAELSRPDWEKNYSPARWCRTHQALPSHPILVHGNEFPLPDLTYLKEIKATVVHCPSTHLWFARKPFPLAAFQSAQIPLALGTDSPASSAHETFDLRPEVRLFLQYNPTASLPSVWEMLTTVPAQALGQKDNLGTLQPGRWADWVGWRLPLEQDPLAAIFSSHAPAEFSCVAGEITPHEKI